MAEPATNLISVAEAKAELRIETSDTANDQLIQDLITGITDLIETDTDRQIVSRNYTDGVTETHLLPVPQTFIYTRNRPLKKVIEIRAGGNIVSLSSVVIDLDAGEIKSLAPERARLMPNAGPFGPDFPEDWNAKFGGPTFGSWSPGPIEIDLVSGYESTAKVSYRLKRIALDCVVYCYRRIERKDQGITSVGAPQAGTVTRYALQLIGGDLRAFLNREGTYSKTYLGNVQASA